MLNQPLISVIIPTYNGGKYLREAISSVVEQTYVNKEIIITDDGSSDNTLDIAREFAAQYPYIKIIAHTNNLGTAKNYNLGVAEAKGEYGLALGQDDILPPYHLERMIKHFTADDIALVHCNAMIIDENGKEQGIADNEAKQIRYTADPMRHLCFNNFIKSCGLMFRMQAFKSIGMWDESYRHCSEWMSYILYAKNYKFAYATDTYAYYRRHSGNLSKKMKHQCREEYEQYKFKCRSLAATYADLSPSDTIRLKIKMMKIALKNKLKI